MFLKVFCVSESEVDSLRSRLRISFTFSARGPEMLCLVNDRDERNESRDFRDDEESSDMRSADSFLLNP